MGTGLVIWGKAVYHSAKKNINLIYLTRRSSYSSIYILSTPWLPIPLKSGQEQWSRQSSRAYALKSSAETAWWGDELHEPLLHYTDSPCSANFLCTSNWLCRGPASRILLQLPLEAKIAQTRLVHHQALMRRAQFIFITVWCEGMLLHISLWLNIMNRLSQMDLPVLLVARQWIKYCSQGRETDNFWTLKV